MRYIFSILALSLVFSFSFAQKLTDAQKWYHSDFETTGVYGVATEQALDFLKSKKIKPKTVIVGVLDSGVDVEHEDLNDNLYVNKKEEKGKEEKDDDKNGYVDDVYGWNFIGNPNGEDVNFDTFEMTRIIKKYQSIFEGENAERFRIDNPDKYEEYQRAKKEYNQKKGKAEQALASIKSQKGQALQTFLVIKDVVGDIEVNQENIDKIEPLTQKEIAVKGVLSQMVESPDLAGKKISDVIKMVEDEYKDSEEYYQNMLDYYLNLDYDSRGIVGDDYGNNGERFYGNNDYEGPDAEHGTHVAGIIAAERNNDIGINGIAGDVAKILTVRTVPDGDERDKDVANAIIYAVDNGAKVINMSFGKAFSPHSDIVAFAIRYAQDHDVLLVHAAGNDNKDIDIEENYPTNFYKGEIEPYAKNWITVGSSTSNPESIKSSFSNFGAMKVDLFAPGSDIYSLIPDNKYKSNSGTSMASPVVAGCAAVLRAYFPKLTAVQTKEILMKSVNKSTQETLIEIDLDGNEKLRGFDALSVAGGVVDLNKAVRLAYDEYK
ncbi:MAG: S8 family serine peptidase [Flavobacteriales bacterium]|nr:S8 family serine peptidase [Flavobacteriales bacterium]